MSKKPISDEERKSLLQSYSKKIQEKTIQETEEDDDEEEKKGTTLIIAFLLMLVFQLGNRIFGRLQTYPMHNYPLFLNMVMIMVYIPICFAYVIPVIMSGSNWITQEQREIPKYKFAVMGAYDSIAGIMQTFAVNYITNASMIVLVQQSAIPISMVISRYALQATYTKAQYIGAAVVLFGIVVVLIPNFFSSSTTDASTVALDPNAPPVPDATTQLIWLLVLIISCVPMCLSSVYKEKALGETEIDIMYLNGWVAVFQFLIAIPLCFPTAMVQNLPLSELWPNMVDGMKCWMGINSITEEHNPNNLPLDDCSTAPLFVTIYLFFNVVFNFLIVVILKLGSANIMWMASTVIVPLSNVAFSMDFMPGHQPLRFWDIIGLMVIMLGLVIYRFSKELLQVYEKMVQGTFFTSLWASTTATLSGTSTSASAAATTSSGYTTPAITAARAIEAKRARLIAKKAQEKQLKFLGINQMEYLQTLVESRVEKEQTQLLYRSPGQIRSTYLVKIGVPPSPHFSMGGPGRRPALHENISINNNNNNNSTSSNNNSNYNSLGYSPMMLSQSQRKASFRATSGYQTSNTSNLSMSIGNNSSYSSRELHIGAMRSANNTNSNNSNHNTGIGMSPMKPRTTTNNSESKV